MLPRGDSNIQERAARSSLGRPLWDETFWYVCLLARCQYFLQLSADKIVVLVVMIICRLGDGLFEEGRYETDAPRVDLESKIRGSLGSPTSWNGPQQAIISQTTIPPRVWKVNISYMRYPVGYLLQRAATRHDDSPSCGTSSMGN